MLNTSYAPGTYYVWVVADNNSALVQSNENNDYAVSAAFTVTAANTVDVQPLNVGLDDNSVLAGGSLGVVWLIRNNGTGTAGTSSSQVRITQSNAATGYGNSTNNVGSPQATGSIAAGVTIEQVVIWLVRFGYRCALIVACGSAPSITEVYCYMESPFL